MAYVKPKGKLWQGCYRDETGKVRVAGSDKSKRKALALAQDEEAKIRRGDWSDPEAGKMTFAEYFEEHWLPNRDVSLNHASSMESHYRTTLKEAFGKHQVRKITGPMVQRWVIQLGKTESPRNVEAKFKTLNTCLGGQRGVSAVRDGLIRENPCKGVTVKKVAKKEVVIYDPAEISALVEALAEWWRIVPMLAEETGFRWGELLGLRVSDFSKDFIDVTASRVMLQSTKAKSGNGTPFSWKPELKGGDKPRTAVLSPHAATYVARVVKERQLFPGDRLISMADKDGVLPRRTDVWPDGLPPTRNYFRTLWYRAHAEAGIERRPEGAESDRVFHSVRGSFISWLLMGGADVVLVMELAGHEQMSTTQMYAKALRRETRGQAALVNARAMFAELKKDA